MTIIGLGLIGGSLGMAIKRRRLARTVVGVSRRTSSLRQARRRGAIDAGTTDPQKGIREADMVILATPVETILASAGRLARFMRAGSVLTDVGSVKGCIVRALDRRMPRHVSFVGAHPIAGSEARGLAAAQAGLFDGSVCVLTPTARTPADAVRAVRRLWTPLVRRVVIMTPARHDRLLAALSHLPHLVAYCLAGAAPGDRQRIAPRSFLEMTRIAKSDPDLWDDIFLSNREALLQSMAGFDRRWRSLRTAVARSRRAALRRQCASAKSRRESFDTP